MIPWRDGADVPAGSLPADMLYLILRHAARPADGSKGLYRDMVQLLCVCRHWRAAALPIVYRCLEITHGAEDVLHRMMNARGPVQMGPDAGPVTNAYFISGLGCLDLVRCVEISVIHISSPFSGLDSIFRVLQQLMDQWPEVRFLNINLRHMNNRFVGRPVNLHAFQSEASVVADKVCWLFPNVVSLGFESIFGNPIAQTLYGQITDRYARQVRRLKSSYPIRLSPGTSFEWLASLDISFRRHCGRKVMSVYPGNLTHLRLRDVSVMDLCQLFGGRGELQPIMFTRLQSLKLIHSAGKERAAKQPCVVDSSRLPGLIHLPRLKSLHISTQDGAYPLLLHNVFPSQLQQLTFNGSFESLALLDRSEITVAGELSLYIKCRCSRDAGRVLSSITSMSSKACRVAGSTLVLYSQEPIDIHQCPPCPCLTKLSISLNTKLETVLGLLELLPNLLSLTLACVLNEARDYDMTELEEWDSRDTQVEAALPLKSRLEALKFINGSETVSDQIIAMYIRYLVLRLPTLRTLIAWNTPAAPMMEFVDTFKQAYPHLGTIQYTLRQRA